MFMNNDALMRDFRTQFLWFELPREMFCFVLEARQQLCALILADPRSMFCWLPCDARDRFSCRLLLARNGANENGL